MSAGKSFGVNKISFDLEAFEVVVRANYELSLRDRKQRTFQQVVDQMLERPAELDAALIEEIASHRPRRGDAILSLRLDRQQQYRADYIKNRILHDFGYHWQLRDLVVYLCKALIKNLS
jgi:hypothetical protein